MTKRNHVPSPAVEGSPSKKVRKASLAPSSLAIAKPIGKKKISLVSDHDDSSSELSDLESSPVELSRKESKKRPRRAVKSPIIELTSQADSLAEWEEGGKFAEMEGRSDDDESVGVIDQESEEEREVKRKASPKKRKKVPEKKGKTVGEKKVVKKQNITKALLKTVPLHSPSKIVQSKFSLSITLSPVRTSLTVLT